MPIILLKIGMTLQMLGSTILGQNIEEILGLQYRDLYDLKKKGRKNKEKTWE